MRLCAGIAGVLALSTFAAGAATEPTTESDYKFFFGVNAGMHGWNYATNFTTISETLLPMLTASSIKGGVKVEFPKSELLVGMEGGVRFGKHKSIWNGGFTVSAEKTMGKKPDIIANKAFLQLQTTDVGRMLNTDGTEYTGAAEDDPAFLEKGRYARSVETSDVIASKLAQEFKFHTNVIALTFDNYIRLNKSKDHRFDLVLGVGVADIETNMNIIGLGVSESSHAAVIRAGVELELTEMLSLTMGSRMYVPVSSQFYSNQYSLTGGVKFMF